MRNVEAAIMSTRADRRPSGSPDALVSMSMVAFFAMRGAYSTLLDRERSEHGVSTVHYALVVALFAFVVAVVLAALTTGVKGFLGGAHSCVNGLTTSTCKGRTTPAAVH
jgi:Flp pilus assembly pilin Flp